MKPAHSSNSVDVLILGGSLSGASLGLLLKRENPEWSVVVVEKGAAFNRRVGESTSEVGGCYLTRVLRLARHLSQEHIVKHGLRLWFQKEGNECLSRCGEIGPFFQARLPTYQLDRATLDQHVLDMAESEGCDVVRPARSTEIFLGGEGKNRVMVKTASGEERIYQCKWVIDATGKAAVIGRQRDTLRPLTNHVTKSLWARFRGVKDLDGAELAMKCPEFVASCSVSRSSATNHLLGRGWWCWLIPLKNGDVSAGVTYDPRYFNLERRGNLSDTLLAHLREHPVGKWMFEGAEVVPKDTLTYTQLAYENTEVAGDGWASVGDAAGFMDPLYSHGIDFIGHTVMTVKAFIAKSLRGEDASMDWQNYQRGYQQSYRRWFEALYEDKYAYLGDADLMRAAFLLDIGAYFIGPVDFVYRNTELEFSRMPYHGPVGGVIAKMMRFYNRRLVKLADLRQSVGLYGANNLDNRYLVNPGFSPGVAALKPFSKGLWAWWKCELQGVRHRFLPWQAESTGSDSTGVREISSTL
ncbi:tryptophan 7-halogenase [Verrucomicrobiales bacterium]|jgi:flavin-dependent dehydrogenase|nr:tryptophan 7-halogenase [Verrucomicrobiales bacterium]MDF1784981.1 tryptophan 7-halogenase [Verrucomicrobiales bacterium]